MGFLFNGLNQARLPMLSQTQPIKEGLMREMSNYFLSENNYCINMKNEERLE